MEFLFGRRCRTRTIDEYVIKETIGVGATAKVKKGVRLQRRKNSGRRWRSSSPAAAAAVMWQTTAEESSSLSSSSFSLEEEEECEVDGQTEKRGEKDVKPRRRKQLKEQQAILSDSPGLGVVVESDKVETVAIKIIKPVILRRRETRRRFENEVAILWYFSLPGNSHPNIPTFVKFLPRVIYESKFGPPKSSYDKKLVTALITEYINGGELHNFMSAGLTIPEEVVKAIFQQLVRAVVHLHRHGCVHGDIKTENVMLGMNGMVVLGDFGCAQLVDKDLLARIKARFADAFKQCGDAPDSFEENEEDHVGLDLDFGGDGSNSNDEQQGNAEEEERETDTVRQQDQEEDMETESKVQRTSSFSTVASSSTGGPIPGTGSTSLSNNEPNSEVPGAIVNNTTATPPKQSNGKAPMTALFKRQRSLKIGTPLIVNNTLGGTPAYQAPEVNQVRPYDGAAADVFSLGVVLYMMLYSRLPYNGAWKEVRARPSGEMDFVFKNPETLFTNDKKVSEEAKDLVLGMLAFDAEKRITLRQIQQHPWVKASQCRFSAMIVAQAMKKHGAYIRDAHINQRIQRKREKDLKKSSSLTSLSSLNSLDSLDSNASLP